MLWEMLTGREHLQFYGRLKSLNGSDLDTVSYIKYTRSLISSSDSIIFKVKLAYLNINVLSFNTYARRCALLYGFLYSKETL